MDHLETNWKYRLKPYQNDRFAVEILEDEYKGVVFLAGRVQFTPIEEDDRHKFKYEYQIIENPDSKNETEGLKKMIGDIIIQLLYEQYSEGSVNEYVELDGGESDSITIIEE